MEIRVDVTPVQKALWYIESRFHDDFSLKDVACASGVSQHYLIRAFGKIIGTSVMKYVKARRLSEAAKLLVDGAPDILTVALMVRYKSHEAFTRGFYNHFQILPRKLRERGTLEGLNIQAALKLDDNSSPIGTPVISELDSFTVTGLSRRYDANSKPSIPALWNELDQYLGRNNGQLGMTSFGVCSNFSSEGSFDYLCGTNSPAADMVGMDSQSILIPRGLYATFEHVEHISSIRNSWHKIYNAWLPRSEYKLTNSPEYEIYSAEFDPITGNGSVAIRIPLERQSCVI